MATVTRFAKGTNGGTKRCRKCGDKTWASRIDASGQCSICRAQATLAAHDAGQHTNAVNTQCTRCLDS